MLKQYGVPKFLSDLRAIGFNTLKFSADHYGLTLILGGAEVCLWETSMAYLRMAQSVVFSVQKQQRETRFDWGQVPLFTEKEADLFTDGGSLETLEALIHVNRPEDIDWKRIPSMRKVAWKTGTSYGFRDAWAVGVTPEYVVGVWSGNADGEGRPGLTGTGTSALVMLDIFNLLEQTSWFEMPTHAFKAVEVCKQSGCLASRHCSEVELLPILPAGLQAKTCPYHTIIHLSEDERYRVFADCYPPDKMVGKTWFVLPPIQEWFYKKRHPNYKTLPPLSPQCSDNQAAIKPMEFIYPNTTNAIRLSKQLDGSVGALALELAHRHADAIVYWHLDETYLGSTQYFHQMSVVPKEGKHIITVVDEWGNTLSRGIEVRLP
jgi:penicillin-binding protein 1C